MTTVDTADLRALQASFVAQLMCEALAEDDTEIADANAHMPMLRPSHQSRRIRFDVYHHAYRARMEAALLTHFPALHSVMGDEAFRELAQTYLRDMPSRKASIRWFGDSLTDWMTGQPSLHPALTDLARLEWALSTSFDAIDQPALSFDALLAAAPEDWVQWSLRTLDSVQLLPLQWNIGPVWHSTRESAEGDETGDAPMEPVPMEHHVLVWRQGRRVQWRTIQADEAALLHQLSEGTSFAALCESDQALAHGEAAAAWVASALRRWVDDGLLMKEIQAGPAAS